MKKHLLCFKNCDMFEVRKFHKDVYVDGNIVLDSNEAVSYLDLVACANSNEGQYDEILVADKTLTESDGKIIHYVNNDSICNENTIYYAKEGVTSCHLNLGCENNPYRCVYTYNHNIADLNTIFSLDFENVEPLKKDALLTYNYTDSRRIINRMLYMSIISNYELFMMDLLSTCYMRFPKVKESYQKSKRFNGMTDDSVINKLSLCQYNNFEEVANLLQTLLVVEIPDYSALKKAYNKRNDIAHRYNLSIDGKMVVIPTDELVDLVRVTNKFVYELFEKVIDKVYDN